MSHSRHPWHRDVCCLRGEREMSKGTTTKREKEKYIVKRRSRERENCDGQIVFAVSLHFKNRTLVDSELIQTQVHH